MDQPVLLPVSSVRHGRRGAGVAEILDQHITLGSGRFRGIRVGATWDASSDVENHRTEPPQGLYSDSVFRDAFAELAKRILSFGGVVLPPTDPGVLRDLARAHPDNRIVLDHFGGPIGIGPYADKKDEVFEEWKANLADLATCENVVAKSAASIWR